MHDMSAGHVSSCQGKDETTDSLHRTLSASGHDSTYGHARRIRPAADMLANVLSGYMQIVEELTSAKGLP